MFMGTTAIEGNTLDIIDTFELLYGDENTVIDKYEWNDITKDDFRKQIKEARENE